MGNSKENLFFFGSLIASTNMFLHIKLCESLYAQNCPDSYISFEFLSQQSMLYFRFTSNRHDG